MTSYLVAGPADEPITLAQARTYLRLEHEAEDGLIQTLIGAARIHIEAVTGRAMLDQTWRIVRDDWPQTGEIIVPVGPVKSIVAVRTYDAEGTEHAQDASGFLIDGQAVPARIIVPRAVTDIPMREKMGIEIDYRAGFGAEPELVPNDLVQAMLVLVGYWFENRDAVMAAGSGAIVPAGFDRLVSAYKRVRL